MFANTTTSKLGSSTLVSCRRRLSPRFAIARPGTSALVAAALLPIDYRARGPSVLPLAPKTALS